MKAILPHAAPGDAGNPFATILASFKPSDAKAGWSNVSNCLGSTFNIASSLVNIPSSTKSTAIFKAAWAVLLPFLVWRKYNFPSSIVNSMSCISL